MRPSILLLPLLLAACDDGVLGDDTGDTEDTADTDSGDSDDTATDTDTDTGTGCTAAVSWQSPRDDEQNVSITKIVTVRFSTAVDASDWALTIDGVTGTAALASNGLSATFDPTAELATDTSYTLRSTVCGATTVTDFRTASGPVTAATLEDRTYAVAYEDVTWVEPAGISSVLSLFGQPFEFVLLHVDDIDEVAETITATATAGVTEDGTGDTIQDPCTAPTVFDPADFAGNPVIEIGPADLTFDAAGNPITVQGAYFKSVFIESGDAIGDIDISGQIDVAALSSFACALVSCVPCYSNPAVQTCAAVRLTADRADWIDGLVFDSALDPTQNAACN